MSVSVAQSLYTVSIVGQAATTVQPLGPATVAVVSQVQLVFPGGGPLFDDPTNVIWLYEVY